MSDLNTSHAKKIIVEVDVDLEDLIPGFLERRQQDLLSLQLALDQKDFKNIGQQAHTLKGVGGGYGFDAISCISREMQLAAENSDTEEIADKIKELADYLSHVEVVFI